MRNLILAALLLLSLASPSLAALDEDGDWLSRFATRTGGVSTQADQNQARAALNSFLFDWLVAQDVEKAVTATDIALAEVAEMGYKVADQTTLEQWKRKWLTMWLYRDHGQVNSLGHGDPSAPGFAQLASKAGDVPGRASWSDVPACELIRVPAAIGRLNGRVVYAAIVPMKTAPRDQVIVFLAKMNGRWKIVAFESIAG